MTVDQTMSRQEASMSSSAEDHIVEPQVEFKEPLDLDALQTEGTVFEFADSFMDRMRANEKLVEEQEKQHFLNREELLRVMGDDGSSRDENDLGGVDDDDDDLSMAFDELAERMEPLTPDGGVRKRIVRPGSGPTCPPAAFVTIHYSVHLEFNVEPYDSTRLRNKPDQTLLESLIVGLQMGIQSMRRGEMAKIMARPEYAYGKLGCPPRIPGNSSVLVTVELIRFVDCNQTLEFNRLSLEEQHQQTFEDIMAAAKGHSEMGRSIFRDQKDYQRAKRLYEHGINLLNKAHAADVEQDRERNRLMETLRVNAAVCCKKLGKAKLSITHANEAIRLNRHNAKAHYIKGSALLSLMDVDKARECLERADKLAPGDACIQAELVRLNSVVKEQHDAAKTFAERVFRSTRNPNECDDEFKTDVRKRLEAFKHELTEVVGEGVRGDQQQVVVDGVPTPKSAVGESNDVIPFGVGYDSEPRLNFIESVCKELGLGFERVKGGGCHVTRNRKPGVVPNSGS